MLVKREKVHGNKDIKEQLESLGYPVLTLRSVDNYVRDAGMRSYLPQFKPLISEKTRKARLAFALAHEKWTIDDWLKVVYSDECKIEARSRLRARVTCDPNAGFTRRRQLPVVKHDPVCFMIWACITYDGFGTCAIIEGNLDANKYCIILDNRLRPVMDRHPSRDEAIFQADNDPKHTSKAAQEIIEDNGWKTLDWPANSPDLNAIENLFTPRSYLRAAMTKPHICTTLEKLRERLDEVIKAYNTPENVQKIKTLYESMPRRMKAVIKAKGGATLY